MVHDGFNDIEHNAALLDRFPGKLIVNGRWDPRDGEAGLQQLEADHAKYGIQGVKLYTAEWKDASRGWKLTDPEAVPFLDKCVELGIKNIHVHKGPTIWPLDKDAFDVSDIDHVATDFQELNFIVEHVGLPRIEDFCFMATQEPNVYAGLAVVVGGLMHARPRFFAKVMGELLFWVGEDKMLFGSRLRHLGAQVADRGPRRLGLPRRRRVLGLPALDDRRPRRRSSASTRPSSTASTCRRSCGCPAENGSPGARDDAQLRRGRDVSLEAQRPRRARARSYDPELDEPITTLGFVGACVVSAGGDVEVRLRLPTPQCAPNFAYLMAADARAAVARLPEVASRRASCSRTTTRAPRSTPRWRAAATFADAFPGETDGRAGRPARALPAQGAASRARRACARGCWATV